jgi:RHS repeat-associated protein
VHHKERDANNLPQVSYTRGRDLSGNLQGAGGIGGLLARTDWSAPTPQQSSSYYHSDGNGNVTVLINTNQIEVARYEFDPFGGILSLSGPLAEANLYRFSSKEVHQNSGLVYFLYRFCDPRLLRWLNRDPIGETACDNLSEFNWNSPIDLVDPFGLYERNGKNITVRGCEIVIVYGHGDKEKPFQFNFPPGENSAGAAVTCFNRATNCKIPMPNRIKNAPDDEGLILWAAPIKTDQNKIQMDESGLPSGNKELEDVIKGSREKAEELVKSGKCKEVTIRFVRVPKNTLKLFPDHATPDCPADIVVPPSASPKPPNPKPSPGGGSKK